MDAGLSPAAWSQGRERVGQLPERIDAQVRAAGLGPCGVQMAPRPTAQVDRDHAGFACGQDVVVDPVADVGDLGPVELGQLARSR